MKRLTAKFLKCCKEHGITKVAIGMRHKSVPDSMNYPSGFESFSVFAYQPKQKDVWPPIWEAVSDAGMSCGCSNGNQSQIDLDDMMKLDKAVFHLKKGKWIEIERRSTL